MVKTTDYTEHVTGDSRCVCVHNVWGCAVGLIAFRCETFPRMALGYPRRSRS